MRRSPSFLSLRAFEAAARLQSFALAADELHLTPSAISHQVKALEIHFDRALFTRSHRGVTLTESGDRLVRALAPAFAQIETACRALTDEGVPAPPLAVHSAPSFASKWLGPRLPDFMRLNPAIGIRLSSGAEQPDLLRHEEIDILICYGTVPRRAAIVSHSLGPEDVAPLASPASAARLMDGGDAAWAAAVLIDSSLSPIRWSDWFAANGLPNRATGLAFDRGALAIAAAVQGLGVALESTRFAVDELRSGALVALGPPRWRPISREMHWLCHRRTGGPAAGRIEAFSHWLRAAAPLSPDR